LTSVYARAGDTFIRREVEQLRRLGYVVHTFSIRRAGPEEVVSDGVRREQLRTEYLLEAGTRKLALAALKMAITRPGRFCEAVQVVCRSVPPGIAKRWPRQIAYLLEASYLAGRLELNRARHLHNHIGENSAVVAMLTSILTGIPYSMAIHGPGEFDRPTLLALDEKIRRAKFVATISEFTRSQLYRWCPLEDWRKIHVVHCGLDETFLSAPLLPSPGGKRFVNVGRLSEQKGQLLLVEAAALLQERGHDFELVIVGDGPLRAAIEQRIEQLSLGRRVRVTGFLSNQGVRDELLAARALVLPSFAEGLPVAIMEALALGRPVISTYIAGIPELVQPGINGWLVPPGAVAPLADAMAEALTADPSRLEAMGRAGAARVAERHDVRSEARKLIDLFECVKTDPFNQ